MRRAQLRNSRPVTASVLLSFFVPTEQKDSRWELAVFRLRPPSMVGLTVIFILPCAIRTGNFPGGRKTAVGSEDCRVVIGAEAGRTTSIATIWLLDSLILWKAAALTNTSKRLNRNDGISSRAALAESSVADSEARSPDKFQLRQPKRRYLRTILIWARTAIKGEEYEIFHVM